jgi:SPP1 gp7 family putative phage head morphogenesis protein
MVNLSENPTYKKFIKDRDLALEDLHNNAQLKITDILRSGFKEVMSQVYFSVLHVKSYDTNTVKGLKKLDDSIDRLFQVHAQEINRVIMDMRSKVFLLSSVGEGEAIGRGTGRATNTNVSDRDIAGHVAGESPTVGPLLKKTYVYFSQIRRDIMQSIELGLVLQETPDEVTFRAYKQLPRRRTFVIPRKILKDVKVREAGGNIDTGWVTNKSWRNMVQDYKTEYGINNRGPEDIVNLPDSGGQQIYAWELERDLTQQFVEDVRAGQVDAMKKNGIIDFIWISIIDDRTDECCAWRDGLLVSEIKDALKGEHSDDECDAIVPPAHVNCRCTLAPAMESIDEVTPSSDLPEFDEWLEQKANQ